MTSSIGIIHHLFIIIYALVHIHIHTHIYCLLESNTHIHTLFRIFHVNVAMMSIYRLLEFVRCVIKDDVVGGNSQE